MLSASAASSASRCSSRIATPRGTPVEPEVSLTTAMPPQDCTSGSRCRARESKVGDGGRPGVRAREDRRRADGGDRASAILGGRERIEEHSRLARAPQREKAGQEGRPVGGGETDETARLDALPPRFVAQRRGTGSRSRRRSRAAPGETTIASLARRATSRANAPTMPSTVRSDAAMLELCDTRSILSAVCSLIRDA